MTASTALCVGGPLDGQYRSAPDGCISFRQVALRPLDGILAGHVDALAPVVDLIEYRLVWSTEHGRFVWWCRE